VALLATKALQQRFPELRIAGSRDGYWKPEEENAVVAEINRSGAAVLLAALGQPKQELFLDRHRRRLKVKVAMGVGGSLEVLAGRVKRAPRWLRRLGLEWLGRLLQEPSRWRRMLGLPQFVYLVLRAKIRG
jgi:N-acetylglucosaminyldiphosphoundecaprenol N-acetyl-beta-D-mannosaminyltransferase